MTKALAQRAAVVGLCDDKKALAQRAAVIGLCDDKSTGTTGGRCWSLR